ncbi:SDR family NAD(P)-dependent oxidoreductase [Rhodococcus opacus]|uniref:SDR family NAD(P)-dependent oxidoreductase n=1 Tax=Rhodococcus opacus TaxID=37919 RepID=UPI001C47F233|nr:SDR family oxidoreductase [Rhodococcus opacus]MBV6761976.1 SDR family oxidoreductase [Rhodococcus opacus]
MTTTTSAEPVIEQDYSEVPDYAAMSRLDGQRFVVLGGGVGIGRQTCHALAGVGAKVLLVDVDQARADQVAAEIDGIPLVGDVTRRDEVERIFDVAVDEMGGVDGVVDIVGMGRWTSLLDADDEHWDYHHDIVLRHAYYVIQSAAPLMARNGGGPLVFVSSVSGISSAPGHVGYGVAKAGLMSLIRTAAVELGPEGIRVNSIAPGLVWTPRIAAMLGEELGERNGNNTPLRRRAYPEDIASALLFLATPLSGYITGQNITVDGGLNVTFPYETPSPS